MSVWCAIRFVEYLLNKRAQRSAHRPGVGIMWITPAELVKYGHYERDQDAYSTLIRPPA